MMTRTTTRTVAFARPFALDGIEGLCPAGSYDIVTDEETIDDLTFLAWRRTATVIYIRHGGAIQAVAVDPTLLEGLILNDQGANIPCGLAPPAPEPGTPLAGRS